MEKLVYLDTHAVMWLYDKKISAFPAEVLRRINHDALAVSPMVLFELEYLYESDKINCRAQRVVDELGQTLGLKVAGCPFEEVVREAARFSWTRDPFDRIIVAHAMLARATLITKDEIILKHYPKAVWSK